MTNTKKAVREFESALNQLIAKECWSITQAAGSWILADIGAKILRDEPIKNERLSEEQRNYEGEYIIHVQHCAWRIETPKKVLASWRDDNSLNGRMWRTLHKIAGRKIESCTLSSPSFDLVIQFEGEMIWHIFCDLTDRGKKKRGYAYTNYNFKTPTKRYGVDGQSHLFIFERTED